MAKRKIARLDAVRDQITSAIRAYFLWDDLVSSITLAGAAERVLSDKQPDNGLLGMDAFSIRSMINLYIKDEYQSKAAKLFRSDYDFFRHADRKPQNEYELSEEWVEFLMFISICAFQFLGHMITEDMRVFVCWFYMKYPHWLQEDHPLTAAMKQASKMKGNVTKKEFYIACLSVGS